MNQFKKIISSLLFGAFLAVPLKMMSQESEPNSLLLDINSLFELVVQNNPTLKVSEADIAIAEQNVKVSKNSLLPSVSLGVSAYYLSDVDIYSTKFDKEYVQDMPHFGNSATFDANQLIWKGGQVRESIKLSELQVDVANLQYTSAEQQARLTALSYFLDLYKLQNKSKVYARNIQLSEQQLGNIISFAEQGMVTRNDVIRGELMLSNLKLSKLTVDNNILILNKQLNVAIGLPEETVVIPDLNVKDIPLVLNNEFVYQQMAEDQNPSLLLSKKATDISESALKIARKDWYPSLVVFAGNALQRPITSATPAVDKYYNTWNAGLSLSFELSSLWKTKKEVTKRRYEVNRSLAQAREVQAYIGVGVKSAYIKHEEAVFQNKTLNTNKELAEENYRMMEKKYNNQLAILIDLLDAANTKLEAELQYANSEVNIIYAYYKLLKEVGNI